MTSVFNDKIFKIDGNPPYYPEIRKIDDKEYNNFGVQSVSSGGVIITNTLFDLITYEQALYAK